MRGSAGGGGLFPTRCDQTTDLFINIHPGPSKQVSQQVFPISDFSMPFEPKAFSPTGPLTVDQLLSPQPYLIPTSKI
jgi:hypothetical protein